MKHDYSGTFKRVSLLPLTEEYIENLRLLRNRHRECFVFSGEISRDAQVSWYINYLEKENDYVFSVFAENIWVGSVSIYNISNGIGEFGRLIIDKTLLKEKGIGLDTTICACDLAFNHMGITELTLQVYESNIPAHKTYLKAGFTETGRECDSNGKTLINMAIKKHF